MGILGAIMEGVISDKSGVFLGGLGRSFQAEGLRLDRSLPRTSVRTGTVRITYFYFFVCTKQTCFDILDLTPPTKNSAQGATG